MIRFNFPFATQAAAEAYAAEIHAAHPAAAYGTTTRVRQIEGKWVVTGYRFDSAD